jgi:hypothetical protein
MKKVQFQFSDFMQFFQENLQSQKVAYKGYASQAKEAIIFAILFWQYIRNIKATIYNNEEYRYFLKDAMGKMQGQGNRFVVLILMIEYLPTSVWRNLLWEENIDFMSFESFLRRLDPAQAEAIKVNYTDLDSGVIPRVMKKGLRSKVKVFFKVITLEKLMDEPYVKAERNTTRAAWAYSLLGLDFGFGLYPEGDNNDFKITNKSFTRFLSIKNHINDFVVNQENGKYWAMYRSARSNVAFRSGKTVELKSHICPGFWWTLFVHLMFWILSPVVFTLSALALHHWGFSTINLVLLLAFSLTPVWLLIFIVIKLIDLIPFPSDESAAKVGKIIGIGIAGAIILLVVGAIFFYCFKFGMFLELGILYSVLLIPSLIGTIVLFINTSSGRIWDDIPDWAKNLYFAISIAVGVRLVDLHIVKVATTIWHGICIACSWIADCFTEQTMLTLWVLIVSYSLVRILAISFRAFKDEEKFVREQRSIMKLLWVAMGASVVYMFTNMYEMGVVGITLFSPLFICLFIGLIIGMAVFLIERYLINYEMIGARKKARVLVDYLYDSLYKKHKISVSTMLENKFLIGLPEETTETLFDEVVNFIHSTFYKESGEERSYLLRMFALYINEKTLEEFEKSKNKFSNLSGEDRYFVFLKIILRGLSFETAVEKHVEEVEVKEQITVKRQRFFSRIFSPIKFVFIWIGRFFLTLKDIYVLFNKYCPSVSKTKVLED